MLSLLADSGWLARGAEIAGREGAWHWQLEFAPLFCSGGFDLQVGNPPWVRPTWQEDLVLAEWDSWWATVDKAPEAERRDRRKSILEAASAKHGYLGDLASHEGVVSVLGSVQLQPALAGVQINLYMTFMDTAWRQSRLNGCVGLLHPEGHLTDPDSGRFRSATYGRLRRHFSFINELMLFEDVGHPVWYGIHVYGNVGRIDFLQVGRLLHPATADASLLHDGNGEPPGIQYPAGGWDLRPHRDRLVTVDSGVLADWSRLFDPRGTPPEQARLLRPVTIQELAAVSTLAESPVRLEDNEYHWTSGWHEKGAKTDGTIRWSTEVPRKWSEVILQGPHFAVANPFAKQPNENCRSKGDYSEWGLETLRDRVVPRTNYQPAIDSESYNSRVSTWNGRFSTGYWRVGWRRMTQPGGERSMQAAILPTGPYHVGTVCSASLGSVKDTVVLAGMMSGLPYDYLVKVSGKTDLWWDAIARFPLGGSILESALLLRALRLNCLTAEFSELWGALYEPDWLTDRWAVPGADRVGLGRVLPTWKHETPLRRDYERRLALVEIDALSAMMLGLNASQLCTIFRTHFAVLRKYEYAMAFDCEGRKICKHHQSAGFRQAQLQQEAKDKKRGPEWKSVWKMFEQWEEDPGSVDWEGQYTPPFTRPDREAEMIGAYVEFQRRLDAGEYG